MADQDLIKLTADIVAAHVSNNNDAADVVPVLTAKVYDALVGLGKPAAPEAPALTPAVSIRASVKPHYVVCLEDGKRLKMFKRYLITHYQLTPEQCHAKWNLPADYPMVVPTMPLSEEIELNIDLGHKPNGSKNDQKTDVIRNYY